MGKSNANGYKKKVAQLLDSHEDLTKHHRRDDFYKDLIKILKEFRVRCEELSRDGDLNGIMHEFGPKTMDLLNAFLGNPGEGKREVREAVRTFLIEEYETIEGSYRDQNQNCGVHQ